jgi:hypothetical protein
LLHTGIRKEKYIRGKDACHCRRSGIRCYAQQEEIEMTYARFVQRAQALACILAPSFYILAAISFIVQHGPASLFASRDAFNYTLSRVAYSLFSYEAHLLMIPAFFALTTVVGQRLSRLTSVGAVMAFLGLGTLVGANYQSVHVEVAERGGLDISWDFYMQSGIAVEVLLIGLPIILYFLANILLGIGILRSGAMPRLSGVLLMAAGLLQFDSNGPQLSNLPLLTGLLAGLCLLVVYSSVAARLWRSENQTPAMEVGESVA